MANRELAVLYDCEDFWGRHVIVTRSVAEHIGRRHPEMVAFLSNACDVLRAPDLVYGRPRVNSYLFYKLGVLTGRMSNTYMAVIVRYNESSEGAVRTIYATTRPAGGDTLVHMRGR